MSANTASRNSMVKGKSWHRRFSGNRRFIFKSSAPILISLVFASSRFWGSSRNSRRFCTSTCFLQTNNISRGVPESLNTGLCMRGHNRPSWWQRTMGQMCFLIHRFIWATQAVGCSFNIGVNPTWDSHWLQCANSNIQSHSKKGLLVDKEAEVC